MKKHALLDLVLLFACRATTVIKEASIGRRLPRSSVPRFLDPVIDFFDNFVNTSAVFVNENMISEIGETLKKDSKLFH